MLLVMTVYDSYVAICHPLHYPVLMSWQICKQLAAMCALIGFLFSLIGSFSVFQPLLCSPNKISHYFCDISPVTLLVCTNTYIRELVIFSDGILALTVLLILFASPMASLFTPSWGSHMWKQAKSYLYLCFPSYYGHCPLWLCLLCPTATISQIIIQQEQAGDSDLT